MSQFDGQIVLVTGAGGGIGRACAHAFGREGAAVMVADVNLDAAKAVVEELRVAGARASACFVDVRDPRSCANMVSETVSQFGGLHVAINNAAVPTMPYQEFEDISLEDWDRAIGINLTGVLHCMKFEAAALRQSGGTAIVNIASMMSRKSVPGQAAYIASKHGVAGLTQAASLDLIKHGIRVNAISPGFVDTPMLAPAMEDRSTRHAIEAMIPSGRVASPCEIAATVLFVASGQASYLVGALIAVDAGATL